MLRLLLDQIPSRSPGNIYFATKQLNSFLGTLKVRLKIHAKQSKGRDTCRCSWHIRNWQSGAMYCLLFQNTHMPVAGMPVLETFRKVVRKIMTAMLVSFPTSLAVYYQNLVTYTGYSHLPESEISFCELPSCVSQA